MKSLHDHRGEVRVLRRELALARREHGVLAYAQYRARHRGYMQIIVALEKAEVALLMEVRRLGIKRSHREARCADPEAYKEKAKRFANAFVV